jgi:dipeptidyl aminopeptidase/acylaminoacyl peptidase
VAGHFVARCRPQPAERFTAISPDGAEIDAWIVRPPDFDATRRYPVLLNVHGGPFTQTGNRFFDEAQAQAAAGYVVLLSNPRGSSGRDTAWGRAISGPADRFDPGTGWGSVDADDVMAVLDTALERFAFIDGERAGLLGGSYGGYMTSWIVGHSDRFKAACSERAVNNLLSLEWNSDIATVFRTELGVTHLDDPEEYLRRSPITYVRNITTPLLILHSEDDLRCPITQAEEFFVALRSLGKEVEFYRFPAESHELSRSGSPVHRVQRFEIILEFFDRHLGKIA